MVEKKLHGVRSRNREDQLKQVSGLVSGSESASGGRRRRLGRVDGSLAAALAAGGRQGDDEEAAAGGAAGVVAEPGVDAADVEAVAALRQHSELVPLLELRQTDGALRRRPLALSAAV